MNTSLSLGKYLSHYPAIAVIVYIAAVMASALVACSSLFDIYDRYHALAAAGDMLARMEQHKSELGAAPADASPGESPFLEGRTLTIAGAALQQRLTSAVAKLGGNVQSLQVDLHGAQSVNGVVSLIASFEIDQPALQGLLYELESGKPFLFIDQLVVQAPNTGAAAQAARLRVLLTLSGRWLS
jgi:general secretion pathway protein M